MPSLEVPADAVVPDRHPKAPAPGERMPPHHPGCLGCGDLPHGLRIETWAEDGLAVRSRFLVRPEHQGGPGLIHGGLLVAAFDESLGFLPPLVRRGAVTAHLETDFRRPIPVDTELWIRAELDGVAGRKCYGSASAHLGGLDGPVAGTARALFVWVDPQHFLRHGRAEDLEAAGASPEAVRAARA